MIHCRAAPRQDVVAPLAAQREQQAKVQRAPLADRALRSQLNLWSRPGAYPAAVVGAARFPVVPSCAGHRFFLPLASGNSCRRGCRLRLQLRLPLALAGKRRLQGGAHGRRVSSHGLRHIARHLRPPRRPSPRPARLRALLALPYHPVPLVRSQCNGILVCVAPRPVLPVAHEKGFTCPRPYVKVLVHRADDNRQCTFVLPGGAYRVEAPQPMESCRSRLERRERAILGDLVSTIFLVRSATPSTASCSSSSPTASSFNSILVVGSEHVPVESARAGRSRAGPSRPSPSSRTTRCRCAAPSRCSCARCTEHGLVLVLRSGDVSSVYNYVFAIDGVSPIEGNLETRAETIGPCTAVRSCWRGRWRFRPIEHSTAFRYALLTKFPARRRSSPEAAASPGPP